MSGERDLIVSSTLRERWVQRTYDSWLGDVVVRAGLRSTLKELYGAYLHRRWDSSVTVSVSGVEAAFEGGQNVPNERPLARVSGSTPVPT